MSKFSDGLEAFAYRQARDKVEAKRDLRATPPFIGDFLHYLSQQNRAIKRENERLRHERDALLSAFAELSGLPESQAWLVARLDTPDVGD